MCRFRSDHASLDDSLHAQALAKGHRQPFPLEISTARHRCRLSGPRPTFPASLGLDEEHVSALVNMQVPKDVDQVRALVGGINYYLQ